MHTNLLDASPKYYTDMFLSLHEKDHNMITSITSKTP